MNTIVNVGVVSGDTSANVLFQLPCWAAAPVKIARMTLTIKLDGNWSSFQLANSAPPLSVTGSAIAPSARMQHWLALVGRAPLRVKDVGSNR